MPKDIKSARSRAQHPFYDPDQDLRGRNKYFDGVSRRVRGAKGKVISRIELRVHYTICSRWQDGNRSTGDRDTPVIRGIDIYYAAILISFAIDDRRY